MWKTVCFSYQAPVKENYDIGVAEATMIKLFQS